MTIEKYRRMLVYVRERYAYWSGLKKLTENQAHFVTMMQPIIVLLKIDSLYTQENLHRVESIYLWLKEIDPVGG